MLSCASDVVLRGLEVFREISTHISPTEADNFAMCDVDQHVLITSAFTESPLDRQVQMYDEFLKDLADAIEENPQSVLAVISPNSVGEEQKLTTDSSKENVVFIVHGHDEPNLYRLKELLRDEYGLTPIVLSSRPGSGKTIIEKFEAEAKKAAFAFVLLTPDDIIRKNDREYSQARPNVIFELG